MSVYTPIPDLSRRTLPYNRVKLDSHQRRRERLKNRQYGDRRHRFVCSHRARCDLLRRFLTCVEIHVHLIFVMHTSAYIDSLVITRYWSLNNIVQSLLSGKHTYMYTWSYMIMWQWTKLKWKIWKCDRKCGQKKTNDGYATNNYMRRRDRRRCIWMHPICHKRISIVQSRYRKGDLWYGWINARMKFWFRFLQWQWHGGPWGENGFHGLFIIKFIIMVIVCTIRIRVY